MRASVSRPSGLHPPPPVPHSQPPLPHGTPLQVQPAAANGAMPSSSAAALDDGVKDAVVVPSSSSFSSPSSSSSEDSKAGDPHSADAIAPIVDTSPPNSQCGLAMLERVAPSMLSCTLTQEVQAYMCQSDDEFTRFDRSQLSMDVRYFTSDRQPRWCSIIRSLAMGVGRPYSYEATTRLTHNEALRLEMAQFSSCVEDSMYFTVEQVRSKPELQWIVSAYAHNHALLGDLNTLPSSANFVDHVKSMFRRLALYILYRGMQRMVPVPYLVVREMMSGGSEYVQNRACASRVCLSEEQKKSIGEAAAAAAVAEAEQVLREEAREKARAKRRRIA